jgi:hypothetical protein
MFNHFQAAASVAPQEPPKPVEKGPIPSEHKVLQDIFSGLVHNCSNVASNAVSRLNKGAGISLIILQTVIFIRPNKKKYVWFWLPDLP